MSSNSSNTSKLASRDFERAHQAGDHLGTTRSAFGGTTRMSAHWPLHHPDRADRRKYPVLRPGGQGSPVQIRPSRLVRGLQRPRQCLGRAKRRAILLPPLPTLAKPVDWPMAALSTLLVCSSVMARNRCPDCPCGRSTSSATFLPMRSYFCARQIDLTSVLFDLHQ
jgi:hypothetical protein